MLDEETLKMLEELGFEVYEYEFEHTGVSKRDGAPIGSGRWPLGSGEHPFQHDKDFLYRVRKMKKEGFEYFDEKTGKVLKGEAAIAAYEGLSTTQFRAKYSFLKDQDRQEKYTIAKECTDMGMTPTQIYKKYPDLFKKESSVRSILSDKALENSQAATNIAKIIAAEVDKYGMTDVGKETNINLGVSKEKLNQALYLLQQSGYPVYVGGVKQVTNKNGQQTNLRIICPPGTEYKEIFNFKDVHFMNEQISYDGGLTFKKSFIYPESLDSKRLMIRYNEEGGLAKDGVMEIRPGVKDLSLGDSKYAQVRIMVDGTHYLKGMAVYNDNLPDGVDILFNTNKHVGTNMKDVLKKIKSDPDNPFGSLIKEHGGQSFYDDPNGKYEDENGHKQSLSLINKRADAGDWNEWSNKLPAQFLSKQPEKLAKRQLKMAIDEKYSEYDEIMQCTNSEVKRILLNKLAESCDANAEKLYGSAISPRQRYQVILPVTSLKDDEVFAPNFEHGTKVALVRFPHESTSQIPILTVNNKNKEARKVIGVDAPDAVGINSHNASRLSGADFDGDTVLVIPTNDKVTVKNKPQYKDLENFEGKDEYGTKVVIDNNGNETYVNPKTGKTIKPISKSFQNKQMGIVSNLITDMTLFGAKDEEFVRAVKFANVIIDSEKHKLDWKQCEKDQGIQELRKNYQGHYDENGNYKTGASSLISQAKSPVRIPKRQGTPKVDEETGELIYKTADEKKLYYTDKNGKKVMRTDEVTKMSTVKNAEDLISKFRTPMEGIYAEFANANKALANKCRKEALPIYTEKFKYDPNAAKVYRDEVKSLDDKLLDVKKNRPKERHAQLLATSETNEKIEKYGLDRKQDKKEIDKIKQKAITDARAKVGAKRTTINITDKEWEAIQAKAITATKLKEILNSADEDRVRELAIPRANIKMTDQMKQKAITLREAVTSDGSPRYTISEIADSLGVAPSTVRKALSLD